MSPRTGLAVLATAAATAALTAGAHASAAPGSAWMTERYYSHEITHAFADVGTSGAGPDDVYVARQSLSALDGARAGVVNGYGVNLEPPYVYFHWTAVLRNGSVSLQAAIDLKDHTQVYPISGGTGIYAGARGTVTLTGAGDHGSLVTLRYRT
jgi:hypothetical protein